MLLALRTGSTPASTRQCIALLPLLLLPRAWKGYARLGFAGTLHQFWRMMDLVRRSRFLFHVVVVVRQWREIWLFVLSSGFGLWTLGCLGQGILFLWLPVCFWIQGGGLLRGKDLIQGSDFRLYSIGCAVTEAPGMKKLWSLGIVLIGWVVRLGLREA